METTFGWFTDMAPAQNTVLQEVLTQQPDAAVVHDSAFYGTWQQRRVVALTQGTVANHDLTDLVQPTLDALADEDVLVVAGLGGREIAPGGLRVPSNARVESFIPFDTLFPLLVGQLTTSHHDRHSTLHVDHLSDTP